MRVCGIAAMKESPALRKILNYDELQQMTCSGWSINHEQAQQMSWERGGARSA